MLKFKEVLNLFTSADWNSINSRKYFWSVEESLVKILKLDWIVQEQPPLVILSDIREVQLVQYQHFPWERVPAVRELLGYAREHRTYAQDKL